jgi:sarcosine oxidase
MADAASDFGRTFVWATGGLDIGLPSGRVVRGARLACPAHGLAHEVVRASEAAARLPAWQLPAGFEVMLRLEAGLRLAER